MSLTGLRIFGDSKRLFLLRRSIEALGTFVHHGTWLAASAPALIPTNGLVAESQVLRALTLLLSLEDDRQTRQNDSLCDMGNCLAASSLTPHNTAVAVQKDEERVHPTVKTTAETKTSKKVANGTTKAANGTATTTSSSSPPSSAQSKATPSFSYTKGVCALEYWEPIELIGEGSISSIHLVRRRPERIRVPYKERAEIMNFSSCAGSDDRSNKKGSCSPDECKQEGKVYALKSIMKDLVRNDRYLEELRREVHTMSQLRHPNIVSVVEAYERKRHIYVILEYCSGGDLYEMEGTTEHNAQAIVRHILQAVAYMHAHKVVHRDLKLENVVFATKQRRPEEVKIIDFGLATKYLSDEYKSMTDKVGTIYTMAPQVLQGVYDLKCDMVCPTHCRGCKRCLMPLAHFA